MDIEICRSCRMWNEFIALFPNEKDKSRNVALLSMHCVKDSAYNDMAFTGEAYDFVKGLFSKYGRKKWTMRGSAVFAKITAGIFKWYKKLERQAAKHQITCNCERYAEQMVKKWNR